jgi:tRNA pseudouridine38-40 synthase
MTRWKLLIEYDGTKYAGWQRQAHDPSVQESIETAITRFCGQDIRIHVAGRTDAGVHARGQIAHFDLDYGARPLSGYDLAKAINAHLRPQPIAILRAKETASDFHARFHAVNKLYTYRILCRPAFPALERGRVWHIRKELCPDKMAAGAKNLLGHHDFTTFRDSQCQAKTPVKTLDRLDIETINHGNAEGYEILIHAEGRSFLHHQVRNMVGTLTLAGEGKWSPEDIKTALAAKDRKKGGPTAPADGLYLMRVDY